MNFPLRTGAIAVLALAVAACGGSGEVSGTVTGLAADGLVLTNGTETIAIAKDATTFVFPTLLADSAAYAVSVVAQPTGLRCSVANGTGVASATAVVANVAVSCVAVFSLSGTVSGLSRDGLVLNDDGRGDIVVSAGAPTFAFPTRLAAGESYLVTVSTQPTGQTCTVADGAGTVAAAAIANVAVSCN